MRVKAKAALPQTKVNGKKFNEGEIIKDSEGKDVIYVISETDFETNNERPDVTGLIFVEIEEEKKTEPAPKPKTNAKK